MILQSVELILSKVAFDWFGASMRDVGGHILFSASDLMRFMGCSHATTLDLERLWGEGPEPREDSEDAALLQKQGDAHEAAHLARRTR